jgi:hypothetical protein
VFNQGLFNEGSFNDAGLGASIAKPQGFHRALTRSLYPNTIERERQVLLGNDSTLDLYTQRGTAAELRFSMDRDFVVYSLYGLAGPEEWFCNLPEAAVEPWNVIREITEIRVKTHGQDIAYKVVALERPVESHCYRMRLQATGDPRF